MGLDRGMVYRNRDECVGFVCFIRYPAPCSSRGELFLIWLGALRRFGLKPQGYSKSWGCIKSV